MPILYTASDKLYDVLDFLDINGNPCQEAKDWCRNQGNITMGEFINIIQDNPLFEDSWVAYCVMVFPKLMDDTLYSGFVNELNNRPNALRIYNNKPEHKRKSMELING